MSNITESEYDGEHKEIAEKYNDTLPSTSQKPSGAEKMWKWLNKKGR